MESWFPVVCLLLCLLYLERERRSLSRLRKALPLRIAVTGTRGKSSVTRLLASCLRESGVRVLAKTTGALPCLILPDGEEQELVRRGNPGPLEVKKVLREAVKQGVQGVVLEMMSIRPESLAAEATRMVAPSILVVTNVGRDHLAEMGSSKEDIAGGYAAAFSPGCTVFIPEEASLPLIEEQALKAGSTLVMVGREGYAADRLAWAGPAAGEWTQNLRLALAVAGFLGIDRQEALVAFGKARRDFGSLRIWEVTGKSPLRRCLLVSAFAANDPDSTRSLLSELEERGLFAGRKKIALLNLRSDRGDRTEQWLEALKRGKGFSFERWVVIGGPAAAFLRNAGRFKKDILVPRRASPKALTEWCLSLVPGDVALVGMGNMGGTGAGLVEYWERTGIPYDR